MSDEKSVDVSLTFEELCMLTNALGEYELKFGVEEHRQRLARKLVKYRDPLDPVDDD